MIYCYDDAIAEDLSKCIDPTKANNVIKITGEDAVMQLIAQISEDKIQFPCICLSRPDNIEIDSSRTNFTAMKKGVPVVFESDEHNVYLEKVVPIKLQYSITVLTTNAIDMDEIVRELLFKYYETYFLTMTVPYESKRKVRFGVTIPQGANIQKKSSTGEYLTTGSLYQSIIPLDVEGAVLVSYTPKHILREVKHDVTLDLK